LSDRAPAVPGVERLAADTAEATRSLPTDLAGLAAAHADPRAARDT